MIWAATWAGSGSGSPLGSKPVERAPSLNALHKGELTVGDRRSVRGVRGGTKGCIGSDTNMTGNMTDKAGSGLAAGQQTGRKGAESERSPQGGVDGR